MARETERRVLNSLDLLPEECRDDVIWALGELNSRKRTQADILFDLNDRLAVKGAGPISKSAFSRRAVRMHRRARQIEERNGLYAGIAEKLTPEEVGKSDIVLGEFLKLLLDDLLDNPDLSPKNAMEMARAYQSVIAAQKTSIDRQQAADKAAQAKLEKIVDTAAGEVNAAGHKVDAATVLEMIRKAYRGEA